VTVIYRLHSGNNNPPFLSVLNLQSPSYQEDPASGFSPEPFKILPSLSTLILSNHLRRHVANRYHFDFQTENIIKSSLMRATCPVFLVIITRSPFSCLGLLGSLHFRIKCWAGCLKLKAVRQKYSVTWQTGTQGSTGIALHILRPGDARVWSYRHAPAPLLPNKKPGTHFATSGKVPTCYFVYLLAMTWI
jgi:hypothetical protein